MMYSYYLSYQSVLFNFVREIAVWQITLHWKTLQTYNLKLGKIIFRTN